MSYRVASAVNVRSNADCLKLAFRWLLAGFPTAVVKFRTGCTWSVRLPVTTTPLRTWADESTLVERFQNTRRAARHLFGGKPAGGDQAFLKLPVRWSGPLLELSAELLRARMRTQRSDCFRTAGFFAFGIDGSRIDLPRTDSHQRACSAARKSKRRPQRRRRR